MTMRLILFTTTDILGSQTTAMALQDRGYEVVTYHGLSDTGYRAQGFKPSPVQVRQNLLVEMLEGAIVVVHPECDPADLAELAPVCRYLDVPMLALAALPTTPPTTGEEVDHLLATRRAYIPNSAPKKEIPTVHFALPKATIENDEVMEHRSELRERLTGAWMRCQRWLDRIDRHLPGMKNPMSREAMEKRKRAYRTTPIPTATTG